MAGEHPPATTGPGDRAPQIAGAPQRPPEPADILRRLRTTYTGWAFLLDERTCTWTACRGKTQVIAAKNPIALRCAIDAAGRAPRTRRR